MLSINIQPEDPATTIIFSGRLNGPISPADKARILPLIQPGRPLVLDFAELTDISGAGLARLLIFSRYVHAMGGKLSVRGASGQLRDIAEASGFLDLFMDKHAALISDFAPPAMARLRTDYHPTHFCNGYALRLGFATPLGATPVPSGVNFAVFSRHATSCALVLFEPGTSNTLVEIPFPPEFKIGDVFAMTVLNLDAEEVEYGFRMDGPFDPRQGHRFDRSRILLDPAARAIVGRDVWRHPKSNGLQLHGRVIPDDFDWQGDRPLNLPLEDLVIYEMHVRGSTRSPSSGVRFPGTFAGLREKIPYLMELGVNCVELLPVFEFDECEIDRNHPDTGERLVNYWGYNTIGFCAPKAGYAATGAFGMQADEFKTLVKELHRNKIEIILDVVFNHTAEGNENGPTLSFRGLDNRSYYMLTPEGNYYNFSGCGNTMNCNHPVVRDAVIGCLQYWVSEYHIDGFRFDLASILGRDMNGIPLSNPPLLEELALGSILGKTKMIAEAWDAAGLYQVGQFPSYGRWAEWNGKYRDCVRKFLKSDPGQLPELLQRLQGSPDFYNYRGPTASINFITCHDGFTLADLVSYNDKHNEANGEGNRDGADDNNSWNCGVEGPTDDPEIQSLRRRQIKNALSILFLSQGVPMLLMGDEMGRTQQGNNNAYCQDSSSNWLDWSLKAKNAEVFTFCQRLIAFRKVHPALRYPDYAGHTDHEGRSFKISWYGTSTGQVDENPESRTLATMCRLRSGTQEDVVYVAFNAHWEQQLFRLPDAGEGLAWYKFADTGVTTPESACEPGKEPQLEDQKQILVSGRSVVILVARSADVSI